MFCDACLLAALLSVCIPCPQVVCDELVQTLRSSSCGVLACGPASSHHLCLVHQLTTCPQAVCDELVQTLRIDGCELFRRTVDRPNLFYEVGLWLVGLLGGSA